MPYLTRINLQEAATPPQESPEAPNRFPQEMWFCGLTPDEESSISPVAKFRRRRPHCLRGDAAVTSRRYPLPIAEAASFEQFRECEFEELVTPYPP
jgi:hypothetical protein